MREFNYSGVKYSKKTSFDCPISPIQLSTLDYTAIKKALATALHMADVEKINKDVTYESIAANI